MIEKTKRIYDKCKILIIAIPLFVGALGYRLSGIRIMDAFYSSFCLYFANPISDEYNILIELARWTAPIAMLAGISGLLLSCMGNQYAILSFAISGGKNIIYSNYVKEENLGEDMGKSSLIVKDKAINWKNKNHIIMFDSDIENFAFYQRNVDKLKNKNVYMCLRSTDPALLKSDNGVNFFHMNDAIARMFWKGTDSKSDGKAANKAQKKAHIKETEKTEDQKLNGSWQKIAKSPERFKIAIVGFDDLGQHMLERALQMHLYSLKQQITYYVIGESEQYEASHRMLNLMNHDKIVYMHENQLEILHGLREMDMIILTGKPDMQQIQMVLGNSNCTVYYYSPEGDEISELADTERLKPYGQNEKLLTEKNIIWNELYQEALEHSEAYNESNRSQKEREKIAGESEEERTLRVRREWNALPGFLRESNISSEDYGEIIHQLYGRVKDEISEEKLEELAELEHIRWCRFHFLHYWRQGSGADGKKDQPNKLHPYLVPYDELKDDIKDYDRISIRKWLKS